MHGFPHPHPLLPASFRCKELTGSGPGRGWSPRPSACPTCSPLVGALRAWFSSPSSSSPPPCVLPVQRDHWIRSRERLEPPAFGLPHLLPPVGVLRAWFSSSSLSSPPPCVIPVQRAHWIRSRERLEPPAFGLPHLLPPWGFFVHGFPPPPPPPRAPPSRPAPAFPATPLARSPRHGRAPSGQPRVTFSLASGLMAALPSPAASCPPFPLRRGQPMGGGRPWWLAKRPHPHRRATPAQRSSLRVDAGRSGSLGGGRVRRPRRLPVGWRTVLCFPSLGMGPDRGCGGSASPAAVSRGLTGGGGTPRSRTAPSAGSAGGSHRKGGARRAMVRTRSAQRSKGGGVVEPPAIAAIGAT